MKHRIFPIRLAVSLCLLAFAASFVSSASADDDLASLRSDCQAAFHRLSANTFDAMKKAMKEAAKGGGSAKFHVAQSEDPTLDEEENEAIENDEDQLAVKIWFTLASGVKINPEAHRWGPKEKFYVHIEATAPVYVSLFQENAGDRKSLKYSQLVYPDSRYSNNAKAIQACSPTRLPVLFEMDDNTSEELMSMIIVRADWPGIQNDLTSQATASLANDNGVYRVNSKLVATAEGTLHCLNARAASQTPLDLDEIIDCLESAGQEADAKKAKTLAKHVNALVSPKFRIIPPLTDESTDVDEICFYLFASQQVGHWQLKIKK